MLDPREVLADLALPPDIAVVPHRFHVDPSPDTSFVSQSTLGHNSILSGRGDGGGGGGGGGRGSSLLNGSLLSERSSAIRSPARSRPSRLPPAVGAAAAKALAALDAALEAAQRSSEEDEEETVEEDEEVFAEDDTYERHGHSLLSSAPSGGRGPGGMFGPLRTPPQGGAVGRPPRHHGSPGGSLLPHYAPVREESRDTVSTYQPTMLPRRASPDPSRDPTTDGRGFEREAALGRREADLERRELALQRREQMLLMASRSCTPEAPVFPSYSRRSTPPSTPPPPPPWSPSEGGDIWGSPAEKTAMPPPPSPPAPPTPPSVVAPVAPAPTPPLPPLPPGSLAVLARAIGEAADRAGASPRRGSGTVPLQALLSMVGRQEKTPPACLSREALAAGLLRLAGQGAAAEDADSVAAVAALCGSAQQPAVWSKLIVGITTYSGLLLRDGIDVPPLDGAVVQGGAFDRLWLPAKPGMRVRAAAAPRPHPWCLGRTGVVVSRSVERVGGRVGPAVPAVWVRFERHGGDAIAVGAGPEFQRDLEQGRVLIRLASLRALVEVQPQRPPRVKLRVPMVSRRSASCGVPPPEDSRMRSQSTQSLGSVPRATLLRAAALRSVSSRGSVR
eukprot:Hpha_TRINITY_DN16745_c2_g3::TRINITY_DN16745_c2_g3_i1::g.77616::m.77616